MATCDKVISVATVPLTGGSTIKRGHLTPLTVNVSFKFWQSANNELFECRDLKQPGIYTLLIHECESFYTLFNNVTVFEVLFSIRITRCAIFQALWKYIIEMVI